jgi:topoisomerase-4 subunit B
VILTTLHSGGKFSGKAYDTSGGLHGVGSSVVNALSDSLEVEVARGGELFRQSYARGKPVTRLKREGEVRNRRGTLLRFHPDPEIFGKLEFRAERLFRLCRSKAYLYRGVEIRWRCAPELVPKDEKGGETPAEATLHFPGGLSDFLASAIEGKAVVVPAPFAGLADFPDRAGRCEWAITWLEHGEGFLSTYANTIPTPQGGTHEAGCAARW